MYIIRKCINTSIQKNGIKDNLNDGDVLLRHEKLINLKHLKFEMFYTGDEI